MPGDETVDVRAFRTALSAFATGVTVVTAVSADGHDAGVTANSFNSVSLEPPMILWSLSKRARSLPVFTSTDYFAVHVLAASQDALSATFAKPGIDKFLGLNVSRGRGGIPLLEGCAARFQCRKAFVHEGGDHLIFVGEVESFDHSDQSPLLFHRGRYAFAVGTERQEIARNGDAEPDSSFSQDFLIYLLGRAHYELFLGLRKDLRRHGLIEDEWLALSLLGVRDPRTIAELDKLLWYTGKPITFELVARLAAAGFAEVHGGHDPGTRVTLTARGRHVVMELVAAAKSVEADAEESLGEGETLLLKSALRKLVARGGKMPGREYQLLPSDE